MTHTGPARLSGFLPKELSEDQQAVYQSIAGGRRASGRQAFPLVDDRGRLRGPFNAMLLSPPVGHAVQGVGSAVRYDSVLSDRVREMAILAVAEHWGSTFEREAHEAVGRTCGLTEGDLAALAAGTLPALTDPLEATALRTTRTLLASGTLSDAEYQQAMDTLGERALFELTTLVGYYGMLALQLRVFAGEGA
ncbi:carboxymuconolactone decarboxylase family protein [Streptomyces sp. BH106]|uniref:carboxymuconolactone decarboxylase family protein n=1 Tax=Streptomyces sp. BH106 TaxID=3410409 RepID=UPI003CEC1ECA